MPRASRRLVAVLLWLAIGLLPLRGWAAVWMPLAMPGPDAVVGAAAVPCHGSVQTDDGSVDAQPHPCSTCELCHAGMLQTAAAAVTLPALPQSAPRSATPVLEPRVPDGLFRPPRTILA